MTFLLRLLTVFDFHDLITSTVNLPSFFLCYFHRVSRGYLPSTPTPLRSPCSLLHDCQTGITLFRLFVILIISWNHLFLNTRAKVYYNLFIQMLILVLLFVLLVITFYFIIILKVQLFFLFLLII